MAAWHFGICPRIACGTLCVARSTKSLPALVITPQDSEPLCFRISESAFRDRVIHYILYRQLARLSVRSAVRGMQQAELHHTPLSKFARSAVQRVVYRAAWSRLPAFLRFG